MASWIEHLGHCPHHGVVNTCWIISTALSPNSPFCMTPTLLPWPRLVSSWFNPSQLQYFPQRPLPWLTRVSLVLGTAAGPSGPFPRNWKIFHPWSDDALKKAESIPGVTEVYVLSCGLGGRETRPLGERRMRPQDGEKYGGKGQAGGIPLPAPFGSWDPGTLYPYVLRVTLCPLMGSLLT